MAITTDKLTWIYTNYGLSRITEAMGNPTNNLFISKIKIGDANGTFYTPAATATALVNPIAGGEFYINEKGLREDNVTVYFKCIFGENSSGYEIREVGLYETIGGTDYLFAISTCQPIVKPAATDNYQIAVDYVLNITSTNLSSVYSQIVLNADNEYATQYDFDLLNTSVLYVEGNLMEQISKNTHILGLNRATQLYEKIVQDEIISSNTAATLCFSNILNFTAVSKVSSYWVFNYSKYLNSNTSIIDLGSGYKYLDLNKNSNLFTRGYTGLAPYINVDSSNYFKLGSGSDFDLLNSTKDGDTPFTLFFLIKNNNLATKNTLLAKSNYSSSNHAFEINKLADKSIEVKLFTDASNYISCTTIADAIPSDTYFLGVRYNGDKDSPVIDIFINFTNITCTPSSVGTYTGMTNIVEDLTSYTTGALGTPQDNIDSSVSIVSLIKDTFTDMQIKCIMLNMVSLSGKDTCLML